MIHILTNTYQRIDPRFGRPPRLLELDLGCGKGGLSLGIAARYPDRLILAADVMIGRLRRVRNKARLAGLTNLELLRASNQDLVAFLLPDNCVSRVHVLCPDPWPKARHRHKRLVTTEFVTRVARVLAPGAVFHLSTDHAPYLEAIKTVLRGVDFFEQDNDAIDDIRDIRTEFELRWQKRGRTVPHLAYRLRP